MGSTPVMKNSAWERRAGTGPVCWVGVVSEGWVGEDIFVDRVKGKSGEWMRSVEIASLYSGEGCGKCRHYAGLTVVVIGRGGWSDGAM